MRKIRDSHGWTLEQVAAATGVSRPTLSRIETGARRPEIEEVASVLTALSVTGPDKDRLVRLARDTGGAWVGIGDGVTQQLNAVAAFESEADAIYEFQVSIVPGILQTPDYARALVNTAPLGSGDRERAVHNRVSRQAILNRPGLQHYIAYIDEAALRRPAGPCRRTMAGQLKALLQSAQEPRVAIRLVPFSAGAYWGCEGPFVLYKLSSEHTVVFQENAASGVFIENQEADVYQQILRNMDNVALDAGESRALIERYLEHYHAGT